MRDSNTWLPEESRFGHSAPNFAALLRAQAPPFARESMRWSADPDNIARYQHETTYPAKMPGVLRVGAREALASLPAEERRM